MGRLIIFIVVFCLTSCHLKTGQNNAINKNKEPVVNKSPISENIPAQDKNPRHAQIISDGAPKGALPEFYQKAKPAHEPISRYGNPDEYRVNGQTYKVMKTAKNYKAKGLASWYGTKFHTKRTSSGEVYDLYAMTAAHKTLPLPTYVKVKNLENNREVVVKVNDRGPFHQGRIIDLSYRAAVKLGMLAKGTARVEVEAISIKGKEQSHARYYLQAGAFSSKNTAKILCGQLQQLMETPVYVEPYQSFFIVKVGPIDDKEKVNAVKTMLAKQGVVDTFSVLQ